MDGGADAMTIDIRKTGVNRAEVTVDGKTYQATYDPASRRWSVVTDKGVLMTNSPKLHSIGRLFVPITIGGRPRQAARPRAPRAPGAPRRARAAQGARPPKGVAFAPAPSHRDLLLVALSATEDALMARLQKPGAVTADARKAFDRYTKLKALALGAGTPDNEAYAALRMACIEVMKLAF
jgi:hypothetical protein